MARFLQDSWPLRVIYIGNPILGWTLGGMRGFERNYLDLALVAIVAITVLRRPVVHPFLASFAGITATHASLLILAFGLNSTIPMLVDLKILAYLGLVALMATSAGTRSDWALSAKWLTTILIVQAIALWLSAGGSFPPPRAYGAWESNYAAMLVIIGLLAAGWREVGARMQGAALLAIILTQSRTALLVYLLIAAIQWYKHDFAVFVMTSLGPAAAVGSFVLRGEPLDPTASNRFQMLDLFITHQGPFSFTWLVGNGPGREFNLAVPGELQFLLNISENIGTSGIYAFSFHSLWLRVLATFGIIGLAVLCVSLLVWIARSPTQARLSMLVLILLSGATMATFYLSDVGPATFLAMVAISKQEAKLAAIARNYHPGMNHRGIPKQITF